MAGIAVPWVPEAFSAPALARIWEDERRRQLELVPFFPGLMTGEVGALVASFAGEPELHHPIRGRVRGVAAFERFAGETIAWLGDHDATVQDVGFTLAGRRGVEELVLRLRGDAELPVAIATDHAGDGRIVELRVYFAGEARPPLLQPDPELGVPGELSAHYAAREDVTLEPCTLTDDGRARAVEYNVVASGRPAAAVAVLAAGGVRAYDGASGRP